MRQSRLLIVCFVPVLLFFAAYVTAQQEPGTLHESTYAEWKEGSAANKYSTLTDWLEEFPEMVAGTKLPESKERMSMVVECIDTVAGFTDQGPNYDQSKTKDTVVSCIYQLILMRWEL